MRQKKDNNNKLGETIPEESIKVLFTRINAQLANFHQILQSLKTSGRCVHSLPNQPSASTVDNCQNTTPVYKNTKKSEWLFTER